MLHHASGPDFGFPQVSMKLGTIGKNSALLFLVGFAACHLGSQERIKRPMPQHVFYRTLKVDGLSIFYRESGPKDGPVLLTTTGYVLGPDGEQALKARLERRSKGIPVLFTCQAAVAAFRALGVRCIALIHPHWFADDKQQLGVAYFRKQGFDVVYANQMRLRGFTIAKSTDPLRKFTEIYPAELYASARSQVPADAEAVLFSGNGFRAIGVIAALEEDLDRPVLTANQVAFWYALRQASVHVPVNGYGRLFTKRDV